MSLLVFFVFWSAERTYIIQVDSVTGSLGFFFACCVIREKQVPRRRGGPCLLKTHIRSDPMWQSKWLSWLCLYTTADRLTVTTRFEGLRVYR